MRLPVEDDNGGGKGRKGRRSRLSLQKALSQGIIAQPEQPGPFSFERTHLT